MAISLSAQNIVKRYGAVVALADGNLDIHSGEVVALIGANGSGKSTLSKGINGVVVLDGGQLLLDGKPVQFSSPHAARDMGISTVFQELSLIPQMSVEDNIWLGREPLRSGGLVNKKAVREKTEELVALFEKAFKTKIRPEMPVGWLSPDEKQIIEILKAVSADPRILILDEATASLDSRQVQRLFGLVQKWKEEGKAIVFVSHRMEEIFQIGDRYTVLRNGRTVGAGMMKDLNEGELISMMIDKASVLKYSRKTKIEEVKVASQEVYVKVNNMHNDVLQGVSFEVYRGELLGLGGLHGQGQRELLHALFGDIPFQGSVSIEGKPVHFRHPKDAIKHKIALVPGDRSKEGLLIIRSILENLLLPSWKEYRFPLRMKKAFQDGGKIGKSLNLVMAGLDEPVSSLSGGNAQKVVVGKWLNRQPQLLLMDDPTKGVDVGTKTDFYILLSKLCDEGKTIILYSSDDEELLGLCDRVLVMHDGMIRTELSGKSLNKHQLLTASLGASNESVG